MSLPSVLAWVLYLIHWYKPPWYNKFVRACWFWSLVFMQDFSVESKTSRISSISTSGQDLEARYKSSNEVNMTPRAQGPNPMLTVKFRQPSHEFTFGVDMSYISYPLVLTPLI
jgi:hypothetical protein